MKYSHDDIVPFKDSGVGKKQQVAEMFNQIAFRYDILNRLLSAGTDIYWRKRAIKELTSLEPEIILDVATGTADMAIMMTKYLHPKKIIGIDLSASMLELGRKKIAKLRLNNVIELQTGDGEAINLASETFDAVSIAFGVRNFEGLEKGLSEIRRVLKPNGRLVVLEFSKPNSLFFCRLYNFYLRLAAKGVAKWVAKNSEAYSYLLESVNAFPEGEKFAEILRKIGYTNIYFKKLSLGICTIYCGSK
jgi:demethylmenaquinone methyltransferase / 2-methoxy-6-polyprenyl-1,4-benzoquinol methylase